MKIIDSRNVTNCRGSAQCKTIVHGDAETYTERVMFLELFENKSVPFRIPGIGTYRN